MAKERYTAGISISIGREKATSLQSSERFCLESPAYPLRDFWV